jgi:hypothetical protein
MTRANRWMPLLLGLGGIVVLLVLLSPPAARADGAPIPPYGSEADIQMPGQKAIIVYDAQTGREDLVLSIQLLGEIPEAAWVVPLPAQPEVNIASAEWFVQLSDLTQPEIVTATSFSCGATAPGGGPGGALLTWLNENGYAFPERGEPILDQYIAEGWYFMATRVRPGEGVNLDVDVQPLWLSFPTDRPVYPMRLTSLVTTPIDVLIYVLADHRMEVTDLASGLNVEFAGQLSLQPESSETGDLGDVLTGRSYYVTKFRNWYSAVNTESDLYFQQAPDDTPYRRVVTRHVAPTSCCPAYPALMPLGLAAGLSLWRRWRLSH